MNRNKLLIESIEEEMTVSHKILQVILAQEVSNETDRQ